MDGGGRSARPVSPSADEEAARLAREQYREAGVPLLDADPLIAPYLTDGEHLLGCRETATVARVDEAGQAAVRAAGPLYVTDRRLLHLADEVTSLDLTDVIELAMADDRILITLAGARGVMLDVEDPRQFRVLVAAAKNQLRAA